MDTFSSEDRLNSWKNIAAFLGRDPRTAQRWERDLGLPVHRVPGQRGSVFAYKQELLRWLHGNPAAAATPFSAPESSGTPTQPETDSGAVCGNGSEEQGSLGSAPPVLAPRRKNPTWWLTAAVIACGVLLSAALLEHRPGPRTSEARNGKEVTHAMRASASSVAADPSAHELYLKGRFYWEQRTPASLQSALDSFSRALELDPNYGQAYAGLAETYELLPEFSSMPASEAFPKGLEAARNAVRLDPQSADAHRALAFGLFYWEWKTVAAFAEFDRAAELDPSNPETHHWYANALLALRRMDRAQAEIRLARELKPESVSIYADQILIEAFSGADPDECVAKLRELVRSNPGFRSAVPYIENILFFRHRYAEWVSQIETSAATSHDPWRIKLAHAAMQGWQTGGEHGLLVNVRAVQEASMKAGRTTPTDLLNTCFLLGDYADTVRYLDAAYRSRDFQVLIVVSDPSFSVLQSNQRFLRIQRSVQSQMNAPESSVV